MKNIFRKTTFLKYLIILIISIFYSINFVNSQITQAFQTAGSVTWVCPPNVTTVQVQCWGAGGGGGNSGNNTINGGHGGGGGAFSQSSLTVIPGQTYYLFVGGGGNGAPAFSTASAFDGQDTWFNISNIAPVSNAGVLSKGGKKGINNTSTNIINRGEAVQGYGTIKYSGGNGLGGYTSGGQGGGSSAGLLSDGTNASSIAGAIAPSGGGNGGAGSISNATDGQAGFPPGGGGGGSDDWQSRKGGDGANGKITLTYTPNCFGSPNIGLVTMFPNSGCGTTQLNAYLLSNEPGVSYQWQNSSDNILWNNISGATATSLIANSNTSIYYRIRSVCSYGDTSYSNVVFYTFTSNPAQPAPTAIPSIIECGQTTVLNAIGGGTSNYTWFSDAAGASQVATGNSFTTPNLSASTNYYVASNILPQYQQTYLIPLTDLVNLTFDCGNGSIFGSGIVGFNWTDVLPQAVNVLSVAAELSIGSECAAGAKTTTLNGASQSGFSTTANCSCNGNSSQTLSLAPLNYVKNGSNQFRVTNASSFGFNSTNSQFAGYFARITVTYTVATPCYSNLTQVPVTIIPASTAGTVSTNQTICAGSTPSGLSFTGISGTIQWQSSLDSLNWINIVGASTNILASAQIGILNSTTYYRVIISNAGCSAAVSNVVKVLVNPLPIVNAGINQVACAANQVILNGSGAQIYSWNNGVINNIPFTINATTTYTVVGTDNNNCQNSDQVIVSVTPQSIGGTASSNQSFCVSGTPLTLYLAGYLGAIQWQNSIDNVTWNNILGATAATLSPAQMGVLTQTTYFRAFVTNGICQGNSSNPVTISVYPTSVSGSASPSQIICAGTQPSPITLAGYTGTIQWYSSPTGLAPWSIMSGATSAILSSAQMGTLSSTKYFQATITSGICTSVTSNIVMINVTPQSVGGSISSSQTICAGTSVTLNLSGHTGSIQWEISTDNSNFSNISSATSASLITGSLTQTTYYRATVTNGFCSTVYSSVAIITVNSINAGLISSNQTICNGSSPAPLVFSSLPIGSGTLSYLWQYSANGITSWLNVPTGTTSTLSSAQMGPLTIARYYRVIVTSTLNGVACTSTSNTIAITINNVTAGVISSDQTFCNSGDPLLFSFTTLPSGSGAISYQWQSSNDNSVWTDLIGETFNVYDPTFISSTKYYRVIVNSNLNSVNCTNLSNIVTVFINSPNGGTIGSDQTICSGSIPTAFTAQTAATGLGILTYSWESSTDNLSWTTILGATLATYTSVALSQNTYFRRKVTATLNSLECSAYSNTVLVTINLLSTAIISANQTICSGTIPSDLIVITVPSGSGTLTYQWQLSTNGTTWTPISGATGSTLTSAQIGSLIATKYYRLIVYSTLNGVTCAVNSNTIIITVNLVTGGTVAANQTVCSGGDPAAFTSSVAGTGSGTLTYQWQYSTDNINWNNVPALPTGTGLTYNAAPILITTYYRRQVISTLNSTVCLAYSNTVTVAVNQVSAGVIGTDQTICSGSSPVSLTFTTPPSGSGTLSYAWQVSTNGITWTSIGTNSSTLTAAQMAALTATKYYRVIVTSSSGVACTATSNTISVTVNSVISGTIGNDQTFCLNGDAVPIIFNSTTTGSGSLTYQWQSSLDNVTWNALLGETSTSFDPPLLSSTVYYNVSVNSFLNSVNCTSLSNLVTVFINNSNGGTIGSDQTICSGSIPTVFTVQSAATGLGALTYSWESSTDNLTWTTISGATLATYTSGALSQNTYFRRKVTATLNLLACSAYSNTVLVTINLLSTATISANQTICSGTIPSDLIVITAPSSSGTLTYQWQLSANGTTWTTISGATGSTLTSAQIGPLTATKYYRLMVYSTLNGVTCAVNSNTIIVTVNLVTGGTVASNQTVCSGGDPAAFTSSVAGTGSGTLTYQWQYSTDNINWNNVPLLPTGTLATYNADPINITTFYRRQTISTLNATVCAANSNVLTVTVNQINAGVIGSDQTICSGSLPASLAFTTPPSGSGTLSYAWQVSTNGITWTSIGTNSSTLTSAQMAALTSTKYYTVIVTSTSGIACTATSNMITVLVNSVSSGVIGSNQTLCANDDPGIISFTSISSGTGTITYQWQSSTDNILWSNIAGANQSSYDPSILNVNTHFRVEVSSTVTPPISSDSLTCSVISNSITVSLNTFTPGIIGSNQSICSGGDPAIFTTLTAPIGSGTFTYQWQSSLNGTTWTTILGVTTSTYNVPIGLTNATYYRRLTYHNYLGIVCVLPSNTIFVGVYSAGTVSSSQSICNGFQPLDLTVIGTVGNIQWQTSTNGTTWTNVAGATSNTLSSAQMGIVTSNKYYRVTISGVTCTPTLASNTVLITVLALPTINAGIDQTICSGNTVILSGAGGITYSWNNGVSNNIAFTPTSTMTYTLIGTASNGCTNTDQVLINVNPTPTVSIINNNPAIICQGQPFTLSSLVTNGYTYQWKRNGVNILGATNMTYTGINNAGNYTLTVTSITGCVAISSPVTISITASPSIFAGADQHICEGDSVMLSATSSTPFNWSSGIIDSELFIPTTTLNYYVSTVNAAGCQGTDSVVVFVHYPTTSTIYTSSLGNYTLNGTEYSQSGVYTQTINNQWGCDSTITLNLTVYQVGLSEIVNDNIVFYPNPSIDGIFNFKTNGSNEQISCRVFNATGQLIDSFENLPMSIDLSKREVGIYFIELYTVDWEYTIKAIKNGN